MSFTCTEKKNRKERNARMIVRDILRGNVTLILRRMNSYVTSLNPDTLHHAKYILASPLLQLCSRRRVSQVRDATIEWVMQLYLNANVVICKQSLSFMQLRVSCKQKHYRQIFRSTVLFTRTMQRSKCKSAECNLRSARMVTRSQPVEKRIPRFSISPAGKELRYHRINQSTFRQQRNSTYHRVASRGEDLTSTS